MRNLFSPDCWKRFQRHLGKPFPLFAFDFDGTLAPFSPRIHGVTLPKKTRRLLDRLVRCSPTVVISGRSIDNLETLLPGFRGILVGNHGVEAEGFGSTDRTRAQKLCLRWLKHLRPILVNQPGLDGLELEDKAVTLSIHYRHTPNPERAKRALEAMFQGLQPKPRIIGGKYVFNLIPRGLPHKGAALTRLKRKLGRQSLFFIGDDVTDEDAFRLKSPRVFTVRVGQSSTSRAEYYIAKQTDIDRVLETIVSALEAAS
jgi:trehalose 6-phosphate phosphatase